jgi:large subunit ribosomal protein L15
MKLSRIPKISKKKRQSKRLGRGYGSGKGGHTVGRGTKGQKARGKVPVGFEGGQIPLYKRLPKIGGFRNPRKKDVIAISLSKLNLFKSGDVVTPEKLLEEKIIKRLPKHAVKILNRGELGKKLTLKGLVASKEAQKKIEKAGGKLS